MEVPLISGSDYPNTYRSFVEMFPDNASCAAYLIKLRWPNGFICSACKIATTPRQGSRGRLTCPLCRHRTYAQAGTIFDKTRTPLTTWFEAAWHVSTAKNGLSAKTLERTLGTKYRVAWTMLQRFRVAMVDAERKPLSGNVEVDETFIGGVKQGGKRGRGSAKSIVVIAIEIMDPKGFGRVRMRHISDASGESLMPFIYVMQSFQVLLCIQMDGAATMDYLNMGSPEKLQSNHLQAIPHMYPCRAFTV